ncbi:MAG TPA: M48 family metallopeptidase [Gemmatimonadaceae bacterium]|jgi:Zn-dependent protease with chaperone function|nr:M48 family metallopeptidase [Gemmatimonadaceae bacterium]
MPHVKLEQISSRAWEHPADRAALNTLRAVPLFDEVVRKVASFFGERGLRQLFLANAVRVSDVQRPHLNAMWTEVLDTLDWPTRPQLYVTQTPFVNAGAVGFGDPFVVVNSGTLGMLSDEEQRFILAHELGHIMSGHTTYRTIAIIILTVGLRNLPFLAGMALLPFQIALMEWYRKAELSSDRAGLLGTQDLNVSMGGFMKLAGGSAAEGEASLEEFIKQAEEYDTGGNAWDTVFKVINTVFRDHPFNTVRASELLKWQRTGAYDAIIGGTYQRRDDHDRPLGDDYADAAGYYGEQTRSTFRQFEDVFARAKDAFNEAWRGSPK